MIPTNKIICGNHLDVLQSFPNAVIDLTVTSPPYDNLRDYKGYTFNFESLAKELFRVTKVGGVVVWVVGDATINGSETGTSFKQALYFKEIGFNLHDTMIYHRQGQNPSSNRYWQNLEYMFIFTKDKLKTFNPIKDRKNKYKRMGSDSTRQKDGSLSSKDKSGLAYNEYGYRENIWYYAVGGGNSAQNPIAFQHPAIFPEKLAHDHIISWSNPGDVVLDPMCGSGTTCFAADQLKRKYIGIDISEEYCQLSRKRIDVVGERLKAIDAAENLSSNDILI